LNKSPTSTLELPSLRLIKTVVKPHACGKPQTVWQFFVAVFSRNESTKTNLPNHAPADLLTKTGIPVDPATPEMMKAPNRKTRLDKFAIQAEASTGSATPAASQSEPVETPAKPEKK
jgi:hypothetical protein